MARPDLDAAFAGLLPPGTSKAKSEPTDQFPGGRAPRNTESSAKRKPEPGDWDANPKMMMLDGEEVEFFFIGDLALALDRRPVGLRKWETQDILPAALWRTAEPTGPQAQGSTAGRRLYSRNQIEMVITAARAFKIDNRRQADWQGFRKFLHDHWRTVG